MPNLIKKILKSIPSKIIPENIHKWLKIMDRGMAAFNHTVQDFDKSMDLLVKEIFSDVKKRNTKLKNETKKIKEIWVKPMVKKSNV